MSGGGNGFLSRGKALIGKAINTDRYCMVAGNAAMTLCAVAAAPAALG